MMQSLVIRPPQAFRILLVEEKFSCCQVRMVTLKPRDREGVGVSSGGELMADNLCPISSLHDSDLYFWKEELGRKRSVWA